MNCFISIYQDLQQPTAGISKLPAKEIEIEWLLREMKWPVMFKVIFGICFATSIPHRIPDICFFQVGYCSRNQKTLSQGALLDMLDDDFFPDYRRVAQLLSNNQLPNEEKIQYLIGRTILNPALIDDQLIIDRLYSMDHGPRMFASFAEQLFAAKGFRDDIVEIIDQEKQFVSDTKSHRERIPTNSTVTRVFDDFRNNARGPNGEVFVQILDDGNGNLQKFANAALNGPRSAVYFANAQSMSDPEKRDSIAVKILLKDNERSRKV